MKFLEKIRNLPESKKRIIFWVIMIVLAAALLIWWGGNTQKRLKDFQMGEFIGELNFPEITFPQLPDFPEEEAQKIEDGLNNIKTNASQESQT